MTASNRVLPGLDQLLFTPEHAADKLDVGRTTIYALMAAGELRSVKIGRCRRIPAAALSDYVNKLTATTNA
jgi:excisionase family DNA binding protein